MNSERWPPHATARHARHTRGRTPRSATFVAICGTPSHLITTYVKPLKGVTLCRILYPMIQFQNEVWGGAAPRHSVASVSVTYFSILDLWHLSRERASESSIRTWSSTTSTLSSLYYFNRGARATTCRRERGITSWASAAPSPIAEKDCREEVCWCAPTPSSAPAIAHLGRPHAPAARKVPEACRLARFFTLSLLLLPSS